MEFIPLESDKTELTPSYENQPLKIVVQMETDNYEHAQALIHIISDIAPFIVDNVKISVFNSKGEQMWP